MDTVVLRSPELGDSLTIETHAEIRRTMAGELCIAHKWVSNTLLNMSFRAITTAQKNAFQALLIANQGKEIQITDPDGITKIGIVTTPVLEFKQYIGTCWWDTSFQFEVTQ